MKRNLEIKRLNKWNKFTLVLKIFMLHLKKKFSLQKIKTDFFLSNLGISAKIYYYIYINEEEKDKSYQQHVWCMSIYFKCETLIPVYKTIYIKKKDCIRHYLNCIV